jgi:hypothetical protein
MRHLRVLCVSRITETRSVVNLTFIQTEECPVNLSVLYAIRAANFVVSRDSNAKCCPLPADDVML